ncbi:MAG: 4Fe-4S binding protein [Deltaproteobacteria bacterium]|nr:4Fe-4S binding protein [Deltaproteobacteria bacterium]MBW2151796.1 4Fe-4S binding protein [Deltaproteobacteria bacterium]
MKVQRKIIKIDEELCDGCGQCIIACAEGALELIDGKARVISDNLCDGLGACIGECPTGALEIIERTAEEFDEQAVHQHLKEKEKAQQKQPEPTLACGCPSAQIQTFQPGAHSKQPVRAPADIPQGSALSHWPVQIHLVPPTAPFLKGADLLVAADCTPIAYPNFHRDFLDGKVVMLGCPKFDDAQAYIQKFADIFKMAGIKSVSVVVMEVPCCQGLPIIVEKGMSESGKKIPIEKLIIGVKGDLLKKERIAA